ncbi:TPA: hypothetical protein ACGF30_000079 [Vibrio cholerae]|nr:hypothetical protein [Vibrio cholerae]EJL6474470.1 hypothetical protein [Vibrio cholerae]
MLIDEYRPACPKCGKSGFIAVNNSRVAKADNSIVMIICTDLECQTIVGCLPYDAVYDERKR